ncbi:CPBP family intramembrane glutamic endopeptidase [uncultured Jatrophihabitans sp.]|uniref:CPBP family intramembrane glutamic endopeptidase n=1 Tax=uncultured Jatrophihabitans sp. TaxID=1610747 RepID=UPI0035CBB97E
MSSVASDAGREDADVDPEAGPGAARPRRLGLELLVVLGVTYGIDGLNSLLEFIRDQITINHGVGFRNVATAPIKQAAPTHQWLDILTQLASIVQGLMPALLAILLLARSPAGRGLGIGLDRFDWRELGLGAGFAAVIGIPGLGLVWAARELGLNAQIVVTDFPDVWYRIPTLLLEAFQQGIGEEIVVCAYVLIRLRQLGWSNTRALAAAAVLRGSYHLYQGYGGFIGNAVMGVVFGWWFQRNRRVWPLIVAHSIIDAVSFIGYVYLHGRVSWI